jgi:hypothetical protein
MGRHLNTAELDLGVLKVITMQTAVLQNVMLSCLVEECNFMFC